jgi:hypothetical protein
LGRWQGGEKDVCWSERHLIVDVQRSSVVAPASRDNHMPFEKHQINLHLATNVMFIYIHL